MLGVLKLGVTSFIAYAFWFILPAYVANGSPVILAKILRKRHPMDFGAKFIDGRRVLGDSKSIEGFVFGVVTGTLTGLIEGLIVSNVVTYSWRGFLLAIGAMVGDCLGSFVKRRLGIESGRPAPILDQLTFLLFALLFAYLGGVYSITLGQTVFLVIVTPLLHLATNALAYIARLKSVPW